MKHFICILMFFAGSAQAQPIWRCGPDGKSYSHTPCAEGHALTTAPTERPDADLAQAKDLARRDQAQAARLRLERIEREKLSVSRAAAIHGSRLTPPAAAASSPTVKKKSEPAKARRLPPAPEAAGSEPATGPSSRRTKG